MSSTIYIGRVHPWMVCGLMSFKLYSGNFSIRNSLGLVLEPRLGLISVVRAWCSLSLMVLTCCYLGPGGGMVLQSWFLGCVALSFRPLGSTLWYSLPGGIGQTKLCIRYWGMVLYLVLGSLWKHYGQGLEPGRVVASGGRAKGQDLGALILVFW